MKIFYLIMVINFTSGCTSVKNFELELLHTNAKKLAPQTSVANPYSKVQPSSFNPANHNWKKYEQKDSFPSSLYCDNETCEPPHMNINGWAKEGENKVTLPKPFDLNFYEFAVASSTDYVLELKKNAVEIAVFREVTGFSYKAESSGGKIAMQFGDLTIKILDIESSSLLELPRARCTEELGYFSGKYLITHSDKDFAETSEEQSYLTEFCIWVEGRLFAHLGGKLEWLAASSYVLEQYGILNNEPTFFVINSFELNDEICKLVLQDLKQSNKAARFEIPKYRTPFKAEECRDIELDPGDLSVNSRSVRYRHKGGDWKNAD